MWRLGLMTKLMEIKQRKDMEVKDNQRITAMLDSLCSN
jgi:chorismate mutase